MEQGTSRYDIKGLAEELEFEVDDIAGLFSKYFEEMATDISDMQKYLSNSDWYMLERVVHNIKGVSINLNIHDVFEEASEFDVLLKQSKAEGAALHVSKLAELINSAEIEIRKKFLEMDITL